MSTSMVGGVGNGTVLASAEGTESRVGRKSALQIASPDHKKGVDLFSPKSVVQAIAAKSGWSGGMVGVPGEMVRAASSNRVSRMRI